MINVMIIEPDPGHRKLLVGRLSNDAGIRVVRALGGVMAACRADTLAVHADVLLVDVDQAGMAEPRIWAAIRVLFPDARVVALTHGASDHVLESVLGVGVTALHRPNAEAAILCRAVRNAAQGVVDFDQELVERAKSVVLSCLPASRVGVRRSELPGLCIVRWRCHVQRRSRDHLLPSIGRRLHWRRHRASERGGNPAAAE